MWELWGKGDGGREMANLDITSRCLEILDITMMVLSDRMLHCSIVLRWTPKFTAVKVTYDSNG